jgi:hypothetical protein
VVRLYYSGNSVCLLNALSLWALVENDPFIGIMTAGGDDIDF